MKTQFHTLGKFFKILAFLLSFLLIFEQSGFAQVAGQLGIPGQIAAIHSSLVPDAFRPLHLRYLFYDTLNNNFKLLLDKGDQYKGLSRRPQGKGVDPKIELRGITKHLLDYFYVGLTLPNGTFWVNLRPDDEANIIDNDLAKTDVGRVMLEADLQLKKDTARFTSPETPEGKRYWDKLYKKAEELFGSQNVTIPTLTRVWILPAEIIISENKTSAYIYKATLRVLLEKDYLKDSKLYNFLNDKEKELNEYSSWLFRESIIPKLTKEVNSSKRYAPLRQAYYSLILAQWFKARFKGLTPQISNQLETKVSVPTLIDTRNLNHLTSKDPWSTTTYFKAYQKSVNEGEYNIKQTIDVPFNAFHQTTKSYFSGGIIANCDIPPFGGSTYTNYDPLTQTATSVTSVPAPLLATSPSNKVFAAEVDGAGEVRITTAQVKDSGQVPEEPGKLGEGAGVQAKEKQGIHLNGRRIANVIAAIISSGALMLLTGLQASASDGTSTAVASILSPGVGGFVGIFMGATFTFLINEVLRDPYLPLWKKFKSSAFIGLANIILFSFFNLVFEPADLFIPEIYGGFLGFLAAAKGGGLIYAVKEAMIEPGIKDFKEQLNKYLSADDKQTLSNIHQVAQDKRIRIIFGRAKPNSNVLGWLEDALYRLPRQLMANIRVPVTLRLVDNLRGAAGEADISYSAGEISLDVINTGNEDYFKDTVFHEVIGHKIAFGSTRGGGKSSLPGQAFKEIAKEAGFLGVIYQLDGYIPIDELPNDFKRLRILNGEGWVIQENGRLVTYVGPEGAPNWLRAACKKWNIEIQLDDKGRSTHMFLDPLETIAYVASDYMLDSRKALEGPNREIANILSNTLFVYQEDGQWRRYTFFSNRYQRYYQLLDLEEQQAYMQLYRQEPPSEQARLFANAKRYYVDSIIGIMIFLGLFLWFGGIENSTPIPSIPVPSPTPIPSSTPTPKGELPFRMIEPTSTLIPTSTPYPTSTIAPTVPPQLIDNNWRQVYKNNRPYVHVVEAGETLWQISESHAKDYKMMPQEMMGEIKRLTEQEVQKVMGPSWKLAPNILRPGDVLVLPKPAASLVTSTPVATAPGQIGKRVVVETIVKTDSGFVAKVRDSQGNLQEVALTAREPIDIPPLILQLERLLQDKGEHSAFVGVILSLFNKSPPAIYTFDALAEDLFGFARPDNRLIALHKSLANNPIALFHEIGEYLIAQGSLTLKLEGNILTISINGQLFTITLEGESLAIAQKGPDNPHYLLRAMQRALFGKEDAAFTEEIKQGQQTGISASASKKLSKYPSSLGPIEVRALVDKINEDGSKRGATEIPYNYFNLIGGLTLINLSPIEVKRLRNIPIQFDNRQRYRDIKKTLGKGEELPPIIVGIDDGRIMLIDGNARVWSAKKLNRGLQAYVPQAQVELFRNEIAQDSEDKLNWRERSREQFIWYLGNKYFYHIYVLISPVIERTGKAIFTFSQITKSELRRVNVKRVLSKPYWRPSASSPLNKLFNGGLLLESVSQLNLEEAKQRASEASRILGEEHNKRSPPLQNAIQRMDEGIDRNLVFVFANGIKILLLSDKEPCGFSALFYNKEDKLVGYGSFNVVLKKIRGISAQTLETFFSIFTEDRKSNSKNGGTSIAKLAYTGMIYSAFALRAFTEKDIRYIAVNPSQIGLRPDATSEGEISIAQDGIDSGALLFYLSLGFRGIEPISNDSAVNLVNERPVDAKVSPELVKEAAEMITHNSKRPILYPLNKKAAKIIYRKEENPIEDRLRGEKAYTPVTIGRVEYQYYPTSAKLPYEGFRLYVSCAKEKQIGTILDAALPILRKNDIEHKVPRDLYALRNFWRDKNYRGILVMVYTASIEQAAEVAKELNEALNNKRLEGYPIAIGGRVGNSGLVYARHDSYVNAQLFGLDEAKHKDTRSLVEAMGISQPAQERGRAATIIARWYYVVPMVAVLLFAAFFGFGAADNFRLSTPPAVQTPTPTSTPKPELPSGIIYWSAVNTPTPIPPTPTATPYPQSTIAPTVPPQLIDNNWRQVYEKNRPYVHVVEAGETLWQISESYAKDYKMTPQEMMEVIKRLTEQEGQKVMGPSWKLDPNILRPGDVLVLPKPTASLVTSTPVATAPGQIGKRAKVVSVEGNIAKVKDEQGTHDVLLTALSAAEVMEIFLNLQNLSEGVNPAHKELINAIVKLFEKSPPRFYTFDTLIADLFGFARPDNRLIALHKSLANNPIALFHEIGEYLIAQGSLTLKLEGNILTISINGQQFSLTLEGESLAIAQKSQTNPHYLLRAMQRALFGKEDNLFTEEIKNKQGPDVSVAQGLEIKYSSLVTFLQEGELITIGNNSYRLKKKISSPEHNYIMVFLVEDIQSGKKVVIKVPINEGSGKDIFSEYEHLLKFKGHPQIVQVVDFYPAGISNLPILVLEYLPGQTLGAFLGNNPSLSLQERLMLIYKIASTIRDVHNAGVVHGDIKPDNIVVLRGKDGQLYLKLLDFHISGNIGDMAKGQTLEWSVPGRIAELEPATDNYSLGLLAQYIMNVKLPTGAGTRVYAHSSLIVSVPTAIRDFFDIFNNVIVRWLREHNYNYWLSSFLRAKKAELKGKEAEFKDFLNLIRATIAYDPSMRPTAEELAAQAHGLLSSLIMPALLLIDGAQEIALSIGQTLSKYWPARPLLITGIPEFQQRTVLELIHQEISLKYGEATYIDLDEWVKQDRAERTNRLREILAKGNPIFISHYRNNPELLRDFKVLRGHFNDSRLGNTRHLVLILGEDDLDYNSYPIEEATKTAFPLMNYLTITRYAKGVGLEEYTPNSFGRGVILGVGPAEGIMRFIDYILGKDRIQQIAEKGGLVPMAWKWVKDAATIASKLMDEGKLPKLAKLVSTLEAAGCPGVYIEEIRAQILLKQDTATIIRDLINTGAPQKIAKLAFVLEEVASEPDNIRVILRNISSQQKSAIIAQEFAKLALALLKVAQLNIPQIQIDYIGAILVNISSQEDAATIAKNLIETGAPQELVKLVFVLSVPVVYPYSIRSILVNISSRKDAAIIAQEFMKLASALNAAGLNINYIGDILAGISSQEDAATIAKNLIETGAPQELVKLAFVLSVPKIYPDSIRSILVNISSRKDAAIIAQEFMKLASALNAERDYIDLILVNISSRKDAAIIVQEFIKFASALNAAGLDLFDCIDPILENISSHQDAAIIVQEFIKFASALNAAGLNINYIGDILAGISSHQDAATIAKNLIETGAPQELARLVSALNTVGLSPDYMGGYREGDILENICSHQGAAIIARNLAEIGAPEQSVSLTPEERFINIFVKYANELPTASITADIIFSLHSEIIAGTPLPQELTQPLNEVLSGRMDINNSLHLLANYLNLRANLRQLPGSEKEVTYASCYEIIQNSQNKTQAQGVEGSALPEEDKLNIRGVAVEAFLMREKILEAQERARQLGRKIIVVANLSYGGVALSPITEERNASGTFIVGTDIPVWSTKVGSSESHNNEFILVNNLFTPEQLKILVEDNPFMVVVDGTTSVSDATRTSAHIPDGFKGYRNFFIVLNQALYGSVNPAEFYVDADFVNSLLNTPSAKELIQAIQGMNIKPRAPNAYKFRFWYERKANPQSGKEEFLYLRENKQKAQTAQKVNISALDSSACIFIQSAVHPEDVDSRIQREFIGGQHKPAYYDDDEQKRFKKFYLAYEEGYGVVPSKRYVYIARQSFLDFMRQQGRQLTMRAQTAGLVREVETIALDLDGTLVATDAPLSNGTAGKINDLLQSGKRVVIITEDIEIHLDNRLRNITKGPGLFIFSDGGTQGYTFDSAGNKSYFADYNARNRIAPDIQERILGIISANFQAGSWQQEDRLKRLSVDYRIDLRNVSDRTSFVVRLQQLLDNAGIQAKVYKVGRTSVKVALQHKEHALKFFLETTQADAQKVLIIGDSAHTHGVDRGLLTSFPTGISINVGGFSPTIHRENPNIVQYDNGGPDTTLKLLTNLQLHGGLPENLIVPSSKGQPWDEEEKLVLVGAGAPGQMKPLGLRDPLDEDTNSGSLSNRHSEFEGLAASSPVTDVYGTPARVVSADLGNIGAYHFISPTLGMIIVVNSKHPDIWEEGKFHEVREVYWMNKGFTQHEAHVIASAEQAQKFKQNSSLTPYHRQQLADMPPEDLQAIINEDESARREHHAILEEANRRGANIDIDAVNAYEDALRKEARRLYPTRLLNSGSTVEIEVQQGAKAVAQEYFRMPDGTRIFVLPTVREKMKRLDNLIKDKDIVAEIGAIGFARETAEGVVIVDLVVPDRIFDMQKFILESREDKLAHLIDSGEMQLELQGDSIVVKNSRGDNLLLDELGWNILKSHLLKLMNITQDKISSYSSLKEYLQKYGPIILNSDWDIVITGSSARFTDNYWEKIQKMSGELNAKANFLLHHHPHLGMAVAIFQDKPYSYRQEYYKTLLTLSEPDKEFAVVNKIRWMEVRVFGTPGNLLDYSRVTNQVYDMENSSSQNMSASHFSLGPGTPASGQQLGEDSDVEAYLAGLRNPDPSVVQNAMVILIDIAKADPKVIAQLQAALLNESDPKVRAILEEIIRVASPSNPSAAPLPRLPSVSAPGGIDFRSLPIVAQSLSNLSANIRNVPFNMSKLNSINLDTEWQEIEKLVNSGIIPEAEKLKLYLQASCVKGSMDKDIDKVISCISDILRIEEEQYVETEPTLKDILIVLESAGSLQEVRAAFIGS